MVPWPSIEQAYDQHHFLTYFHPRTLPPHTLPTWHCFSDRREALRHCDLKEISSVKDGKMCFSSILGLCLRFRLTVPETTGISLRWEQYMCLCYVNKAAFGKPSGHLRMRAGCLEKQYCAERLELSVQTPRSQLNFYGGRGVRWSLSSVANAQWLN